MIDLRLGRWQDALADVVGVDAVICDPPYSARTHEGAVSVGAHGATAGGVGAYAPWSPEDCAAFLEEWGVRCRGWIVMHLDDETALHARRVADALDRVTFPLVPVLQHMPRVRGDGPGSPGHFLAVSRPRGEEWNQWGSLPGWYEAPREHGAILGAKPIGLMRAIVRDYSRPGDLVVDPFAGSGTTALACAIEGRRCITSEEKPEHHEIARRRLARGHTPSMFT